MPPTAKSAKVEDKEISSDVEVLNFLQTHLHGKGLSIKALKEVAA